MEGWIHDPEIGERYRRELAAIRERIASGPVQSIVDGHARIRRGLKVFILEMTANYCDQTFYLNTVRRSLHHASIWEEDKLPPGWKGVNPANRPKYMLDVLLDLESRGHIIRHWNGNPEWTVPNILDRIALVLSLEDED